MGEVTADLLKKIGMTVDFVATDWGTVGQRRASKNPPGQGGWGMFHTWHAGADCANPGGHIAVRASGEKRLVRLARQPRGREGASRRGSTAKIVGEEKAAMAAINKAAMENVVYIPTGFYYGSRPGAAISSGVADGPLPWFWGVENVRSRLALTADGGERPRAFHARLHRPAHAGDDPVMAIVALFVFSLLYIAPGDPAAVIAGDQATPEDVEKIRTASASTGRSWSASREWSWQIVRGDLGTSMFTGLPVTELIAPAHRADAVADGASR